MALYLLNCSVDVTGTYNDQFAGDQLFNDQESVVELLLEQVLGFEDAIAEMEDNDLADNNSAKKSLSLQLFHQPHLAFSCLVCNTAVGLPVYRDMQRSAPVREIPSPPPNA